jgi:hypothetical protein
MDIFLVYGALNLGEIETLNLRLSDYLVNAGFSTSIYCRPGGELQASINKKSALFIAGMRLVCRDLRLQMLKTWIQARLF